LGGKGNHYLSINKQDILCVNVKYPAAPGWKNAPFNRRAAGGFSISAKQSYVLPLLNCHPNPTARHPKPAKNEMRVYIKAGSR